MKSIKDPCFYRQEIYQLVHDMNEEKRIKFITQGNSLNPLALELYNLENTVPISYVPNPIEIDFEYRFNLNQKNTIIILRPFRGTKTVLDFLRNSKANASVQFYCSREFLSAY